MAEVAEKKRTVSTEDLNVNDVLAFHRFVRVKSFNKAKETLTCEDCYSGQVFDVIGNDLIQTAFSADNYDEVEAVTQTDMIKKLMSLRNTVFTAEFVKQNGETRTMRARLLEPDGLRGRSMVADLDKSEKDHIRWIDHRTLSSLTVENVKYIKK